VPRTIGRTLRDGIELDDGPIRVDAFRVVDTSGGRAMVEVVLHEGRNHIVRRLLAAVDLPVRKLVRTQIADVHLGNQRSGSLRALTRQEIGSLFAAVDL
jgi:23S rRNA pseudouridine2605 synthase